MPVALAEDDFVRALQEERACAVWVARLSDGTRAYQDDGRPGEVLPAWLRLAGHVSREGLHIVGVDLKFRSSHRASAAPDGAAGYFFCNALAFGMGMKKPLRHYLLGGLEGGLVRIGRWKVPELSLQESFTREIDNCKSCLIMNPSDP